MLSLTKSIIDIMPPYKIGTFTNNKLKKENERVKQFEQSLLKIYEKFLKFLFQSQQIFHSNVCKYSFLNIFVIIIIIYYLCFSVLP